VIGANLPAIEVGGVTLGVREAVIVLIALAAIYMIVVVVRMVNLRRHKPVREPELPVAPVSEEVPPVPEVFAEEPLEQAPPGLAEEILRQSLEQELAQLRDEVDVLRGELAALREDMLQEFSHIQAAQAVSPIYGDAMQMAAAGYEPAMIAERCGIARAEAELVVALAKSQERGVQE